MQNANTFQFPTSASIATQVAHQSEMKSKPLLKAVLNGAVVVLGDQVGAVKYALCEITALGKIEYSVHQYISDSEVKRQLKGNPMLAESTMHLEGAWSKGDDAKLRRVIYAKNNTVAANNATMTEAGIAILNIDVSTVNAAIAKLGPPPDRISAKENVIEPRLSVEFQTLSLMQIFKFTDEDDDLVTAMKVGKSTALIGFSLDEHKHAFVQTYASIGESFSDVIEKIRLKKTQMVVIIS